MTKFRPCIDIHAGVVKQIVGGTLSDDTNSSSAAAATTTTTTADSTAPTSQLITNYTSPHPASYFADLYRKHNLTGAHVIMLGPGCTEAAKDALQSWPNGLQVGGGITAVNAKEWIERGAEKIIVTSYLFPNAKFSLDRLQEIEDMVGKDRLVVDVSCRRKDNRWFVAMNKWQTLTDTEVTNETLALLAEHCSEFLIHAADVEGLCKGIDTDLVEALGKWVTIPTTYAGGAYSLHDLDTVERLSGGKVDLTYGSALDIFGGSRVKFIECAEWNNKNDVV